MVFQSLYESFAWSHCVVNKLINTNLRQGSLLFYETKAVTLFFWFTIFSTNFFWYDPSLRDCLTQDESSKLLLLGYVRLRSLLISGPYWCHYISVLACRITLTGNPVSFFILFTLVYLSVTKSVSVFSATINCRWLEILTHSLFMYAIWWGSFLQQSDDNFLLNDDLVFYGLIFRTNYCKRLLSNY